MDTSETYIKMNEKAEEIQALKNENLYYANEYVADGLNATYCPNISLIHSKHKLTWLPRQDQLQALSGLSWQEFDKECLKYDAETKEQAGICVVMKCQYKKKWHNENWELDNTI